MSSVRSQLLLLAKYWLLRVSIILLFRVRVFQSLLLGVDLSLVKFLSRVYKLRVVKATIGVWLHVCEVIIIYRDSVSKGCQLL